MAPQMAGIQTYCQGDTARRTVSGISSGGSPATSRACGGVTIKVAVCGTALSEGMKVSFTPVTGFAAAARRRAGRPGTPAGRRR